MAGAALLLEPEPAMAAATVALSTSVSAGGAFWFLNNSIGITTGPAFGIFGSISASGSLPAYDPGFVMTVNGTGYSVPNGIMDVSGTLYSSHAPLTMSGLTVNAQFFFDTGSPTVRAIYTYTNNTASPITVTVQWQNRLARQGGDDSAKQHKRAIAGGKHHAPAAKPHVPGTTSVLITSSGGNMETAADNWVVTNTSGQAYVDSVRFGPSAAVTPTIVCQPGMACSAGGGSSSLLIDQYSLTVPAGQTRALMFFGRISATSGINTTTFNSAATLGGLLGNLPAGLQQSQIVNWFGGTPGPASVPAASSLSLLLTGALIVALGIKFLKRPLGNH
jgi:hypothetical protein